MVVADRHDVVIADCRHVGLCAGFLVFDCLTDSEVQAFVTEVVPHIERIMGRRFKSLPPVVVNDEEAVARVFAGDLEATFRKANPQIPEAELSAAVLAEAYRKLPEILGKYGLKVGKLALMPSHLGATMTQFHIHRKHGPGIMRLLIAHELPMPFRPNTWTCKPY